jgi:hypothetical protein
VTATASAPIANASTPADEEYCEEGQEGGEELASSTVSPSASTTKAAQAAASRVAAFAQPTTSSPVLPLLAFKKL